MLGNDGRRRNHSRAGPDRLGASAVDEGHEKGRLDEADCSLC